MIAENNQYRTYRIEESIFFSKTDEPFGGLSNMAPGYSILINENLISSSEALYQACRFSLFPDIQAEIIKQTSPMTAKMISRKYHHFSRQDWDQIKFKVMKWCLEVKLSQNWSKFSTLLKETGDKNIVELSKRDKVWGAIKKNDSELYGINALGRLLMELRQNYIRYDKKIYCVDPPDITGFLLFEHPIDTVCNEDYYMQRLDSSLIDGLLLQ